GHGVLQRISRFRDRQGLRDDPQAVLPAFQARLAVCDQGVDKILFGLVEETKVGTPGHHVPNDVDTGLPCLGCHGVTSCSQPSRFRPRHGSNDEAPLLVIARIVPMSCDGLNTSLKGCRNCHESAVSRCVRLASPNARRGYESACTTVSTRWQVGENL